MTPSLTRDCLEERWTGWVRPAAGIRSRPWRTSWRVAGSSRRGDAQHRGSWTFQSWQEQFSQSPLRSPTTLGWGDPGYVGGDGNPVRSSGKGRSPFPGWPHRSHSSRPHRRVHLRSPEPGEFQTGRLGARGTSFDGTLSWDSIRRYTGSRERPRTQHGRFAGVAAERGLGSGRGKRGPAPVSARHRTHSESEPLHPEHLVVAHQGRRPG